MCAPLTPLCPSLPSAGRALVWTLTGSVIVGIEGKMADTDETAGLATK